MYRLALAAALFACTGSAAGPLIIGVRGGARLNDIVDAVENSPTVGRTFEAATGNYVVGPTLGFRMPLGFSLTGDALFTRLTLSAASTGATAGSIRAQANSWEFPVMLRWTAGDQGVAPFVGAGVSVRHLGDFADVGRFIVGNNNNAGNSVFPDQNTVGFVIGGGLRFKAGALRIEPEIRYTRWNQRDAAQAFRNFFEVNRNQAQILLGLTF
jgi:hypothetical protein